MHRCARQWTTSWMLWPKVRRPMRRGGGGQRGCVRSCTLLERKLAADIFDACPLLARSYAIPAVNCVTSSSVNACLEAAAKARAPVMIQFSSGGAQFYAGKGLDNTDFDAAIAGAVSGAYHVRKLAAKYGVPVILHTDHCAKKLLPWVDGMPSHKHMRMTSLCG